MKIFITGASGFVGGAVVSQLNHIHEFICMSRSESSDAKIRDFGGTPVRCALNEVNVEHLRDCEVVVHSAAFVESWGPWESYWTLNVDATKQLLEISKSAGVKRFIHIGTEAALFHGQHMRGIDESYPLSLDSPFPYSRTKAHAEQAVRRANVAGQFETVVIRPRLVWGPGDQTLLPEIEKMVAGGGFVWIDNGSAKTSTVFIDNLVEGIRISLTTGRGGEAYFITDDEILSMRDIMSGMAEASGLELPNKRAPGVLVRAMAYMIERVWRLFNIKSSPPITRFAANIMSRDCTINIDKAKSELKYKPVCSVAEGLTRLARSYS